METLFINANLSGHINPTLGLVKKLTERGNRVDYFCAEPFAEAVTSVGAKWIGYGEKLEIFFKEFRPTDRHPFYMLMEYMLLYDETVLPELIELITKKKYDLIICDSYFGAACFLKQLTDVPVVCSHSSFAMSHTPVPERMLVPGFHPQLDFCNGIIKRICTTYQIPEPTIEQVFISKGDRNIVYTTKMFNGDEEVHEPEYIFAGPSLDRVQSTDDFNTSDINGRKVIYISLGSVNTNFLDFYRTCIQAFQNTDYYVCMSIGRKLEVTQLGKLPENFMVRNFLPQLEILQYANSFITPAGFNSVNEALYFGVPMLALPLVNDQAKVAKHIEDRKLGITGSMQELSPEVLLSKAESIMMDSEMKDNCVKMSKEMRETADLAEAVCILERLNQSKCE